MTDSILSAAGSGPVLPPAATTDPKVLCISALQRAAAGDWKAAAWWLSHHPDTRGTWGDAAIREEFTERVLTKVVAAIADAGLPAEWERRVLLHIQTRIGALPAAEPS